MHGWTDTWINGWMYKQTNGRMYEWMDGEHMDVSVGRIDGRMEAGLTTEGLLQTPQLHGSTVGGETHVVEVR